MKWYYKFGFSTGQYKGLVLILALNAMFIVYYLVDNFSAQNYSTQDFSEFEAAIANLENTEIPDSKTDSLFLFNPNTVSVIEMELLGLDNKLATRIENYRNKGGEFRKPKDVLNIYGIDSTWFYKVESFVLIPEKETKKNEKKNVKPFTFNPNTVTSTELLKMNLPQPVINSWMNYLKSGGNFKTCDELSKLYSLKEELFEKLHRFCFIEEEPEFVFEKVDLNIADSITLLKLTGIGPTYAGRIVEYRNKLGGFVSQEQLLEVYGMDSTRITQFSEEAFLSSVEPIIKYVNLDEFKVLLRHPYLNYYQVKSIVNFREAVEPLKSVDDLIHLEGFNESDVHRLKPYLSFKIKN